MPLDLLKQEGNGAEQARLFEGRIRTKRIARGPCDTFRRRQGAIADQAINPEVCDCDRESVALGAQQIGWDGDTPRRTPEDAERLAVKLHGSQMPDAAECDKVIAGGGRSGRQVEGGVVGGFAGVEPDAGFRAFGPVFKLREVHGAGATALGVKFHLPGTGDRSYSDVLRMIRSLRFRWDRAFAKDDEATLVRLEAEGNGG